MDIRDCLREKIKEKGITQFYVAKKANLSPVGLSNRLLKKRNLEANEMLRICKAIDENPFDIWTEG